jgi:predicted nuclease of restriction endonuclease-like RecB superfamily
MLTSDQSIVEFKAGQAFPDRLTQSTHRHYVEYTERMLSIYRSGKGRQRRELHRQIEALFMDEPDCPVRRIQAFCKLLDDRSIFQADLPGKASKLRLDVFFRAARLHPLVEKADRLFEHEQTTTKAQIADALGSSWGEIESSLYADVIAFQRLEQFEDYPSAAVLLSRYNVAQLQACLYRAERMVVVATNDLKTILRYAKLAKLLHEIDRLGPSKYRITFSGPASVLFQTRRYGVNFAKFLPALLACKGWRMTARLKTPWNTEAHLNLSDRDGFTSHLPSPDEFDSSLEKSFAKKFGLEHASWQLIREGEILHDRQGTFVPDFTFRHNDGTQVCLEIVGFWTPEYLEHKRRSLQKFRHHHVIIAVPEKSLKEGAHVGENVLLYKTALKLEPLLEILERIRAEKF